MPDIAQGNNATINIAAGTQYQISTVGEARIDYVSGFGDAGFASKRLAGDKLSQIYGPYPDPVTLKVNAISGIASYKVYVHRGNRVLQGVYDDTGALTGAVDEVGNPLPSSGGGGAVSSVAGKTGVVTLVKADVGLGNVDNTSDANKPVSTAQATAIAAVTKSSIGLGNVDNTSDANKPVSTAQAAAIAKEQPPSTTTTVSRNLVAADVNALVKVTSASSVVLTIPNDATLGTSDDETIAAYQAGAGVVSFAAGSGVTLRSPSGVVASVQYATKGVQRVGANEWALLG